MDGLQVFLVTLLGIFSCSHDSVSGSVFEVMVRPGDNITLYCDCELSSGVYIVWYRNCSHENQPSLVLPINHMFNSDNDLWKVFPRFQFVRNFSSASYDLLIMNITDSDEGLYYCGTGQTKVEDKEYITRKTIYTYSNITTRIIVNTSEPHHHDTPQDYGVCWSLLFSLCPAIVVLFSPLSFLLVYHLGQKKEKEPGVHQKRPDTRDQARWNQDEDVLFTRVVYWAQDG